MTLLLVLGVVVIATILAAFYLSLKSGRDDEPAPGGAGASDRQAKGGSRSGRSASLAGRVRSIAGRGKADGSSRRHFGGGDEDEYDVPDYVTARRSSRRAGGDRSSLVTAGTGHRAGGRTAAGFDETDPALHAAYGHAAAGYDGYDAAADTHVSGPMGAEPGTGPYATGGYDTGGYDTGAYDAGSGPSPGYGGETPGGYRGRAGERGRAGGSARPGRDAGSPKFQKPQRRMGRSRQDYDNDPWPSADEIDGVSDDQFWSDLSSDKPLATTARTAQAPSDSGRPWAPGDGPGRPGPAAEPGSADMVSALVPATAPAMGRGRRAQRRVAEPEDGTEPRPRQQPDGGAGGAVRPRGSGGPSGAAGPGASGGSRRRGEPMRSPGGAEEDPLTSASFSRHARAASDSRSYQGSRQAHRPSHGRPDASADDTQTMRPDPRSYRAPDPAGAPGSGSPGRGAPGPGGRPGPGGTTGPGQRGSQGLPPSGLGGPGGLGGPNAPIGPNSVGGPASPGDPRGDGGYRTGARPAGPYPEGTGGHEPPARRSRHASPPGGGRPSAGNGRPPASSGRPPAANGPRPPRPALPSPASGGPSYAPPGYPDPLSPGTNGSPAYPGTNGNPPYSGTNGDSVHPGTSGTSPYPGTYRDSSQPGGAGGAGGPGGYPRGRRSSNRGHRRPDDPYEDPYGRPDDGRY